MTSSGNYFDTREPREEWDRELDELRESMYDAEHATERSTDGGSWVQRALTDSIPTHTYGTYVSRWDNMRDRR